MSATRLHSEILLREPFSQCLVEGDEAALSRARMIRTKALITSLLVQIALLAVAVAVPLIATSERLKPYHVVPIPPYRGSTQSITQPRPFGGRARTDTTPVVPRFLYQPPKIPVEVGKRSGGESQPEAGPGPGIPEGIFPAIGNLGPDFTLRMPPLPSHPPFQQSQAPVKRSEGVQQALLVNRVEPAYPALARQAHLEGTVRLRALIGRDGSVSALEVLSGHPILAQAALAAVSQWHYRPTELNHQPVEVETYVTVIFQLQH